MPLEIIDAEESNFMEPHSLSAARQEYQLVENLRLGEILLAHNLITQEQLNEALDQGKRHNIRLGKALSEMGILTQDQINWALAYHLHIPYVELSHDMIDQTLVQRIPEKILRQYVLIPLVQLKNELTVAMADPTDLQAITAIENVTGCKVKASLASASAIQKSLDVVFHADSAPSSQPHKGKLNLEEFSDIAFLNFHLMQASTQGAEEIHFDPTVDAIRIRYRIKGALIEKGRELKSLHYPILSRLKIMANLRVEENLFQQALFKTEISDRLLHLHLTILPTNQGEAISFKLLPERSSHHFSEMSLDNKLIVRLWHLLQKSTGLMLVTGCGIEENAAMLYTFLQKIPLLSSKKIITIEQTSLFHLPEANQISLSLFPGLTYSTVLEYALAQHPDILLVDQLSKLNSEMMSSLLHTGLSGTLIFGATGFYDTFHALEFLRQQTQSPVLLSSTLLCILARSTLRQLCPYCKQIHPQSQLLWEELQTSVSLVPSAEGVFYREKGCPECQHTGYKGVVPLYELLEMTELVKQGLLKNVTADVLQNLIQASGMAILRTHACQMALAGEVSLLEVLRKMS